MSGAAAYLRERRGADSVRTLRAPIDSDTLPAAAAVLRIRPRIRSVWPDPAPLGLLTSSEQEWVGRGGRLVVGLARDYRGAAVSAAPAGEVSKVFPLWPGVWQLEPATPRGVDVPGGHTVFALASRAIVSRVQEGEGDVIILACPEILENGSLARADHLELLESLTAGRDVYFDEASHGLAREIGIFGLMTQWGLGPALVLLFAGGVVWYWRSAVRIGAAVPPPPDARSVAVDLVESLGDLYDRALSRGDAIAMYQEALSRAVARRTGLRREALRSRVAQLLKGPPDAPGPDLTRARFAARLDKINLAFRRLDDARSR